MGATVITASPAESEALEPDFSAIGTTELQ